MTHLRVPTSFQSSVQASPGAALLYSPGADSIRISALYVSAITTYELELGILQLEQKGEGKRLRLWFDGLLQTFSGRILPYDTEASLICARMHSPDPKSLQDSLIAAVTIHHGYRLVTRNTRDFERAGVKLFNPREHAPLKHYLRLTRPLNPDCRLSNNF